MGSQFLGQHPRTCMVAKIPLPDLSSLIRTLFELLAPSVPRCDPPFLPRYRWTLLLRVMPQHLLESSMGSFAGAQASPWSLLKSPVTVSMVYMRISATRTTFSAALPLGRRQQTVKSITVTSVYSSVRGPTVDPALSIDLGHVAAPRPRVLAPRETLTPNPTPPATT